MQSLCVPIPDLDVEQVVEVGVKIDGKSHRFNYRVEAYDCHADQSSDERISGLRDFIAGYDGSWQLMEIGTPTSSVIPLMFRQRQ